jgi:hypothetical protein
MKKFVIMIILIIIISLISSYVCTYNASNLDYIKKHAAIRWKEVGFKIIGYYGYQWGFSIGPYGGAKVWYILRKIPDNGITYSGYLQRWGDEIHVYRIRAYDAIKPQ